MSGELQMIGAISILVIYCWASIWLVKDSRERMIKKNEERGA
jgi:hypothetical protein